MEGHTDAVGSDEDNLPLSDRRAETVATILTQRFQIPAENLTTQGYGEQYLKVEMNTLCRVIFIATPASRMVSYSKWRLGITKHKS